MKKSFSISDGFTLVEVITAIFVMVIVGGIVGAIFLSSIKGTTKATTLDVARQNGAFALSQIEKTLRNTQSFTFSASCLSATPTPAASITLTGVDGTSTVFTCQNSTITSNGSSLIDTTNLRVLDFSSSAPANCSFSCYQFSSADYPTITTQFTVTQKGTVKFYEQSVILPFRSSTTLRNISR